MPENNNSDEGEDPKEHVSNGGSRSHSRTCSPSPTRTPTITGSPKSERDTVFALDPDDLKDCSFNSGSEKLNGFGNHAPKTTDMSKSLAHLLDIREARTKNSFPKKCKKFYKLQDEFLEAIQEAELEVSYEPNYNSKEVSQLDNMVNLAARISFFCNIVLLIAKLTASILSGSMSVISSLVDSAVDLVSGAVIFYTSRATRKANLAHYPFGRTRLEPAAIIIISVVMGLASFQIIAESLKQIVMDTAAPDMEVESICIIAGTVLTKAALFAYCRRIPSPSTLTLAQDHRNDVVGNVFALLCGWMGTRFWVTIDPIGAILISLYIAHNWWATGRDQVQIITGKTAPPAVIAKITWVALHHDPRVKNIDTIRAFHLGAGFLAEVHITMDERMSLRDAHDIGESLQNKLELLSEIEGAFVHLDYENAHRAHHEHAFLKRRYSSNGLRQSLRSHTSLA